MLDAQAVSPALRVCATDLRQYTTPVELEEPLRDRRRPPMSTFMLQAYYDHAALLAMLVYVQAIIRAFWFDAEQFS
jgi:hypothetical protein